MVITPYARDTRQSQWKKAVP